MDDNISELPDLKKKLFRIKMREKMNDLRDKEKKNEYSPFCKEKIESAKLSEDIIGWQKQVQEVFNVSDEEAKAIGLATAKTVALEKAFENFLEEAQFVIHDIGRRISRIEDILEEIGEEIDE